MGTTLFAESETALTPTTESDRLGLAASLVGFQGLLFIITAVEAGLLAAISGNAAGSGPVTISASLAIFSLIARARLRKGRTRRLVRLFQWLLLAWAAIDLALALFLTGTVLPLVSFVSRVALPVTVLVLTRRNRI